MSRYTRGITLLKLSWMLVELRCHLILRIHQYQV